MTAKQKAIQDIKECLRQESKAFIAFRTELNLIMDELVEQQLKEQEALS